MNEYATYYARPTESTAIGNGWGPMFAAIVGGVVGYFVGRNNNGCNNGCGNGGQTAFQQGEYTGESRAADNYIAQEVNGLKNMVVAMSSDAKDQRIADLVARNQALETRQLLVETAGPIACGVNQVNRTLDAATTGAGFTSYPGCKKGCF